MRLAFTRYLSGKPLESLDGIPLKEGFPMELYFMKTYLESLEFKSVSYYNCIRVYMTLMNLGRAFKLKPVLKTETITDPWSGTLPLISDEVHNQICKRLKIKDALVNWKSFHFTTKKGPNGPAMANSPKDLASLPQQTIDDLISIGGSELGSYVRRSFMRTPIKGLSFVEI